MKAMQLERAGERLRPVERADPVPGADQVRLRISACGVCRTDLHVVDGDLPDTRLPIVPGHEVVGRIDAIGAAVDGFAVGDRVGVAWLGHTCGHCRYCRDGTENLCDEPAFTGYQVDGGYADTMLAEARYCYPLPGDGQDAELAPLLCAGLIGYRSLVMAGDGEHLGLYGFGAAAHILAQVAAWQGRRVYAFTRPGDRAAQRFALDLGADWAGDSDDPPPRELDAAIIFAPVGALVPAALRAVRKGGRVICGGIHMSAIPSFPYSILWGERCLRSVANLTRRDALEFLELAPRVPVRTRVQTFALADANAALDALRDGRLNGAAVLIP